MTNRYDHRDAEARADDATKDETTSAPVLNGATELRGNAQEAIDDGDLDDEAGTSRPPTSGLR